MKLERKMIFNRKFRIKNSLIKKDKTLIKLCTDWLHELIIFDIGMALVKINENGLELRK